jgi:hypothetical protein
MTTKYYSNRGKFIVKAHTEPQQVRYGARVAWIVVGQRWFATKNEWSATARQHDLGVELMQVECPRTEG